MRAGAFGLPWTASTRAGALTCAVAAIALAVLGCSSDAAQPPPIGRASVEDGADDPGNGQAPDEGEPGAGNGSNGEPSEPPAIDPETGLPVPGASSGSGATGGNPGGIVNEDNPDIIVDGELLIPDGCGDGLLTEDEACDDGNTTNDDGCNGNCLSVTPGFSCASPGQPCLRIARCGDGLVALSEQCDDQNAVDGDGCSTRCRIEFGKKCDGEPSMCTDAECGNGVPEGAESCDDGNTEPFDGCSSLCLREPNCSGDSCTSDCGDGLMINEGCDDGNTINGDGCSSTCEPENGFTCTQEFTCEKLNDECILRVPAIFRDFSDDHPDFGGHNCSEVSVGAIEDTLDPEGRPVAQGNTGAWCVESEASFAEWYRDGDHATTVVGDIVLFDNGNGGYVNRFGANGEQFEAVEQGSEVGGAAGTEAGCATECQSFAANETQCGNACNRAREDIDAARRAVDQAAADPETTEEELAELELAVEEAMAASVQCTADCELDTETQAAECSATCAPCSYDPMSWCHGGTPVAYDGNPLFFPVDGETGANRDDGEAKVPEQYGYAGWRWEREVFGEAVEHNFYFTSEVQYWFRYAEDTNATLDFLGDDDVWVFINGQLAVDLGGVHVPEEGSVTINAQSAARFGLEPGNVYKITVFHAERQMEGSSFKLTLSGFEATPSDCRAVCGDGVLSFGEECDDGENNGGYGECDPGCVLGAFCGDGIVNGTEHCDYGPGGGAGCPSCRILRVR